MSQLLLVALSRLASSLRRFTEELHSVGQAGDDWNQLDIMVGAAGPYSRPASIMLAIRNTAAMPVNVHLIDVHPDRSITAYPPHDGIMSGNYR